MGRKIKAERSWEINPFHTEDDDIFLLDELLQEEMLTRSEQNLYQFFINFWNTFDPQPLVSNWHLECLCEHIQAALKRQIRRLIINIPPRCHIGTEKINMGDGSYKLIKQVVIGDTVLSSDTERVYKSKVIDVIEAGILECLELEYSDGHRLRLSKEHKVYTVNKGWQRAKDLIVGDVSLCLDTDWCNRLEESRVKEVELVNIKDIGKHECFDLTVENYHNYFCNDILTHNSSKSTTASITAPVWWWINNPYEKFWLISHSAKLYVQNIVYARRILEHPLYRDRWLSIENAEHFKYELSKDVNTKTRIDNMAGGYILGGSPTSGMLGMGYSVAVLDDILDSEESSNAEAVKAVNEWYTQTFLNRSNDVKNDVQIIVMQRLHENDLTAYVQRTYPEQNWFVLNLPAKYDPDRTFISPIGFNDKRTQRNQLLDPVRLPDEFLLTQSKNILVYNTRYQQDPEAGGEGNLVKAEWLRESNARPNNYSVMITVWDLSIKDTPEADFTVGLVLCKFEDEYHIIDMWRKRCEIPEQIDAIRRMKKKYPKSIVGIEAKNNGHAAMSMLQRDIRNIYEFEPRKFGGHKEQRLGAVLQYFRDRKVVIYNPFTPDPRVEPTYDPEEIKKELKAFPLASHDDIVDCAAYGINYLAEYGQESMAVITKGSKIALFDEDYIENPEIRTNINIYDYTDYTLDQHYIPTRSDLVELEW